MEREDVIARLKAHEPELHARGVRHAALFGSLARGEARPDSDIDIFVELEPDAPIGIYEYVSIKQFISDLFSERVDIAHRKALKPYVRREAERDAIFVF
jgi:predicted nucleotidyltransferase